MAVKMADCRRVPLLLRLLCIFLFELQVLGENDPIPKFIPKGEAKVPAVGALGGAAGNPSAAERSLGVGAAASPPRRRSAGWKLSEEPLCRDDLVRLCPKHTWNNNLAVLECLQDRKEETEIAAECNHLLWNYKLNLTTDPKFDSVAVEVCKTTISEDIHSQGEVIACLEKGLIREEEGQPGARHIKDDCKKAIMRVAELSSDDFHLDRYLYLACRDDRERFCENTLAGEGRVYKCLFNHKFEEAMSEKCREALTTRQKLIAQDYKVSYSLAKACKSDLRKFHCNVDTSLPRAREARLSFLLLCLESAVHRGRVVSGECQGEMMDYRRMLMEDFSLSPEIVLNCRTEIETHCSGLHRKGRTLHCLMRVGRGDVGSIEPNCQKALQVLIQEADPGADYRIDRALNEACESVIQTACKHIRSGDPMILSCLMEHLYTEKMVEDCEHRLLELQYFIARDWKLDPILYKKCQGDATRLCHTRGWNDTSDIMPPGAIFSCLYRHAYRSVEQGRRVSFLFSANVLVLTAPQGWIRGKSVYGIALPPHPKSLFSLELPSLSQQDIQIEALLMRACEPVIQTYCHEVADNQIDTGDLMACLVQNKHQKEMNEKCSVGVTHFQLIQIKDFRFSYKFKTACKEDVLKLCPNIKKKVDVVICLSTTVRNDTLQDVKEHRVSVKCRKQLRVEEVEMSEDIRLDPELYESCRPDITKLCQNVAPGNAQIIECLKDKKEKLTPRCHQKVFKLQEVEMVDPELDYQLMRVCKHMIKVSC
uniref:Golgi apparatus protein 1 n=1 Tax=Oryzias sinensis TaxID=183150 RepID=A0A8C7XUK0_9TELE